MLTFTCAYCSLGFEFRPDVVPANVIHLMMFSGTQALAYVTSTYLSSLEDIQLVPDVPMVTVKVIVLKINAKPLTSAE